MKVYIKQNLGSFAVDRITQAIKDHTPDSIEFVEDKNKADLIFLYVNGRIEHLKKEVEQIKKQGKKYLIVQLAIRSTKNPNTNDWIKIWQEAGLVWTYYDLFKLCREDNIKPNFNFYHSPLGLDQTFIDYSKNLDLNKLKKEYAIVSSGLGYLTESARECILASEEVNKKIYHVGPKITERQSVISSMGAKDWELCINYSKSEYVSGLRRLEGFELPVIEGLVCGARPIVFDRPDNHKWFEKYAIFIPETNREKIKDDLVRIFKGELKRPTREEIDMAISDFNWQKIITGLWQKIL